LTWKLGNRTVAWESMDGQADWSRWSFTFTEADTYRLVVIARDASNRTARDTLIVEPRDAPEATGGESGASGGTGDGTSTTGSDNESAGYVIEPADGGGSVTIIHPDYDGDTPGRPNGQIVSATADDIPIPDGNPANIDYSSDPGSSTGSVAASRISGSPTASVPGFSRGSGGGSSGGSSGSSSGGRGPTASPGISGIV